MTVYVAVNCLSKLFSKEMPVQKWTLECLFIEVTITVELRASKCYKGFLRVPVLGM